MPPTTIQTKSDIGQMQKQAEHGQPVVWSPLTTGEGLEPVATPELGQRGTDATEPLVPLPLVSQPLVSPRPTASQKVATPAPVRKMSAVEPDVRPRNLLLSSLSHAAWTRLMPHVRHCLLFPGQVLQTANEKTERIYFPNSGLVSLVMGAQDGSQTEIAMIGSEGIIGTMAFIGLDKPFCSAIVQIAGNACWLPVSVMRDEFRWSEALQERIFHHCQVLTMQAAQGAFCNRLHTVEARLSRWLLSVYDRIGTNEIEITHGHIARMLGTRRSSVTLALGDLQEAGIVDMSRGHITILDREKLEHGACECYGRLRNQFQLLERAQTR